MIICTQHVWQRKDGVRFRTTEENDGLTLKLWRGEGMSLLGFDLERDSVTPQFVGFAVRCKHPGAADFVELSNRIAFHYTGANAGKKFFPTSKAPYQKFRWVHFPREVVPGDYRYECQSASDRDPRSASKRDPFVLPFERLALAPSELVGVAETVRARVVM